jgi:DNA primase small subunit
MDFLSLCLRDQDCFRTERQWETLLALLPSDRGKFPFLRFYSKANGPETIGQLRSKWQADPDLNSEEKWADLMKAIGHMHKTDKLLGVSCHIYLVEQD